MSGNEEQRRRFDALFAAHSADIVAFCSWRAGSASDAQDAAAEVFLTPGVASPMYPTVMPRASGSMRRRGRSSRTSDARTAAALPCMTGFAPKRRLVTSLLRLSQSTASSTTRSVTSAHATARVLLLAEWEDLSPAEIAAVLGCLTVTARGRLHRARHRFRRAFLEARAATSNERRSVLRPAQGGS
jgi:DNA-directed RNA polymerase specialized sigma24 family protein